MYYYFHIKFKDENADIYIVRVNVKNGIVNSNTEGMAREKAKKKVVEELTGVKENDFEIERGSLDNLLSQFVFMEDIAQLKVVTHPNTMKKIFLLNGGYTLVSDEDFLYLVGYNWWIGNDGYVRGWVNSKHQLMHCIVAVKMGLKLENKEVDHIDRNKLNNNRDNLRSATHGQNIANSEARSKSGFKGVYWHNQRQKWQVQIRVNNKLKSLGYFDDPKEASDVYTEAREYYGEFFNP